MFVVPIFMHRARAIDSDAFAIALGTGIAVALLAMIFAIIAFFRIWYTGDRGWGRATTGLIFGLICLTPVAYGIADGFGYPMANDVSTSVERPPVLLTSNTTSRSMASAQELQAAFPLAFTRRYTLDVQVLFGEVEDMLDNLGWEIRQRREPPNLRTEGQINALVMTWFGWRDEVAIRVSGIADGASVDVRSASTSGTFDLGKNGRRIEELLVALDDAIAERLLAVPVLDVNAPVPQSLAGGG
jgi:uncharacterized protein (DUF1499 family)